MDRSPWTIRWPEQAGSYRAAPIAPEVRALLHYDHASSARWRSGADLEWWGFYGRWSPGRVSRQLVSSHSPEICLPTVGLDYLGPAADYTYTSEDRPDFALTFKVSRFRLGESSVWAFATLESDRAAPGLRDWQEWSASGRIHQALLGERNQGQRLLELVVSGSSDFSYEEASLAVRELLAQGIKF